MKQLTLLILILILLVSCNTNPGASLKVPSKLKKYKFEVINWSTNGYSEIYCDSAKMTSLRTANLWVDGILITIISSEKITISTNTDYYE